MEKEFVPYELAVKIKELGFDEPCFAYYELSQKLILKSCSNGKPILLSGKKCAIPTYSQAFRWFREKYELYSWVQLHNGYIDDSFYKKLPITWIIMERESGKQHYEKYTDHNYLYHTYEEAELACLNKLLEIVEGTEAKTINI